MYLLKYKHEEVLASDDKSLKMNHATLIMKENASAILFIYLFTTKVRVISHKSELCSHYKT